MMKCLKRRVLNLKSFSLGNPMRTVARKAFRLGVGLVLLLPHQVSADLTINLGGVLGTIVKEVQKNNQPEEDTKKAGQWKEIENPSNDTPTNQVSNGSVRNFKGTNPEIIDYFTTRGLPYRSLEEVRFNGLSLGQSYQENLAILKEACIETRSGGPFNDPRVDTYTLEGTECFEILGQRVDVTITQLNDIRHSDPYSANGNISVIFPCNNTRGPCALTVLETETGPTYTTSPDRLTHIEKTEKLYSSIIKLVEQKYDPVDFEFLTQIEVGMLPDVFDDGFLVIGKGAGISLSYHRFIPRSVARLMLSNEEERLKEQKRQNTPAIKGEL